MARCPSEEVLRQFAADACEAMVAVEVEAHALICGRCAAKLASFSIDGGLMNEIREALQQREAAGTDQAELDRLERRVTTTIFGEHD